MRRDTVRSFLPGGFVAGACLLASGCSSYVYMSANGNTPPQYTHVFITTQAIWFNAAANAAPDAAGWQKFTLTTPVTIDLVGTANGTLEEIAGHLSVGPGTYQSVQLIPLPNSSATDPSAQAAGAKYNQEVDFVDGTGTLQQVPLQIPNPDQGLYIAGTLKVPFGNVGAALGAATSGTSTTDTSDGLGLGLGGTDGTDTGLTPTTTTTSTSTSSNVTFVISFDAATDVALFTYDTPSSASSSSSSTATSSSGTSSSGTSSSGTSSSGTSSSGTSSSGTSSSSGSTSSSSSTASPSGPALNYGAIINTHAQSYDLTTVGGISGNLSFDNVNSSSSAYTNTSNRLNITVTAELLSADGSRHVAVLSTPLDSNGNFLLYPLPCSNDTSNPSLYDVVIHGAGIETMIIKGVQVTRSLSTTGGQTTQTTTPTFGSSSSGSGPTLAVATANTSLGTLQPTIAASFTVGVTDTALSLPPGAAVGFYQTLNASGEVPYLIETAAMDPINHTLALPLALSSGPLQTVNFTVSGTLATTAASSSQSLTLTAAAPKEQAGNYLVGVNASLYAPSSLTALNGGANAAAASNATVAQLTATLPATLTSQSGAATDTVTALVSASSTYNAGVLLVTNGGTLVASTKLDSVLAAGGSVTVNGVPGGPGATGFSPQYQLSALLWNTNDPSTLTLQSFTNGVDLTNGSVSGVQLTIN